MKLYKSHLLGATMDLTQKRIYFWGGIFSQWAISPFIDADLGIKFNCAEQSMMYWKANTFHDKEAMAAVLKEKNPRNQKAIGRTIKNYDDKVWNEVKFDIVKSGNVQKFSSDSKLKELLIYTDGYELVECSPYDKIWGIGLGEDNPDTLDKSKWRGENLLGKAIVEAREEIIKNL